MTFQLSTIVKSGWWNVWGWGSAKMLSRALFHKVYIQTRTKRANFFHLRRLSLSPKYVPPPTPERGCKTKTSNLLGGNWTVRFFGESPLRDGQVGNNMDNIEGKPSGKITMGSEK